ncbi:MAG: phosphoesterase RecJ protein, phosphoesterase RecJ protein [Candidatus Magasanikbacteria bacterium]|nr:phosphoesterase RecJ protein, phosphoesterase RecJ protein [Candidatus Magasanikbacteria bacterium]
MLELSRQIHHAILTAPAIVLVPHRNPDGDSLGSAAAFAQYVRAHGGEAKIWCSTVIESSLHFLPGSRDVCVDPAVVKNADVICTFDGGDLRYLGLAAHGIERREQVCAGHAGSAYSHPATSDETVASRDTPASAVQSPHGRKLNAPLIINFDHHHTNERFGHFNFVITDAASTTEVLHRYFSHIGHQIDAVTATCLLTGLVTDTGSFNHANTSLRALILGAKLLEAGADFNLVRQRTTKNKTLRAMRLWGHALARLKKNPKHDMAFTVITAADFQELNATEDDLEGLSNFLHSLGEASAMLLLTETNDGKIKGSLRTNRDDVDVSELAKSLGGGGHKKAAGFTIPGRLKPTGGGWEIVV